MADQTKAKEKNSNQMLSSNSAVSGGLNFFGQIQGQLVFRPAVRNFKVGSAKQARYEHQNLGTAISFFSITFPLKNRDHHAHFSKYGPDITVC